MSETINIPTTPEEITPAWLTMALRSKGIASFAEDHRVDELLL